MQAFKRVAKITALVAVSTFLVSCGDTQLGTKPEGPSPIPKAVKITSAETDIVIAAPKGFCVDRTTIDENDKGTFMFLTDCQIISETGKTGRVPISSILTASVSPSGLVGSENGYGPALTSLGEFLQTPIGLFSLGKSNVDGAVSVLKSKQTDAALYLLVQDVAFKGEAGVSDRYWRAFTEVNGRLVALSVTRYSSSDPDEERGLRIIRSFVQAIIDANVST